jgi:ATP dependent DNA ligase domain
LRSIGIEKGKEFNPDAATRAILKKAAAEHKPISLTRTRGFMRSISRSWPLPLAARKAKLAKLLARKPAGIVFNEHTEEDGAAVFRHACKLGFEGIVSKRLNAAYRSGPSRDWLKVKNPESPAMRRLREGRW